MTIEALILAEERSYWSSNTRISFDKAAVEISEAKEYLDVFDGAGGRPFRDGGNAIGFHGDTIRRNDKAEKRDGGSMEFTLSEFASQPIIAEPLKDPFDMGNMLFEGFGENKDIIEVNEAKNVEEFTKAIVGISLE
jgi:hypothetical protein